MWTHWRQCCCWWNNDFWRADGIIQIFQIEAAYIMSLICLTEIKLFFLSIWLVTHSILMYACMHGCSKRVFLLRTFIVLVVIIITAWSAEPSHNMDFCFCLWKIDFAGALKKFRFFITKTFKRRIVLRKDSQHKILK